MTLFLSSRLSNSEQREQRERHPYFAIALELTIKAGAPPAVLDYFRSPRTVRKPLNEVIKGFTSDMAVQLACAVLDTSAEHGSWRARQLSENPDGTHVFISLASTTAFTPSLWPALLTVLSPYLVLEEDRVLVRVVSNDGPDEVVLWCDDAKRGLFLWEHGWQYETKNGRLIDDEHPWRKGRLEWAKRIIKNTNEPMLFFQPPMDIIKLRAYRASGTWPRPEKDPVKIKRNLLNR